MPSRMGFLVAVSSIGQSQMTAKLSAVSPAVAASIAPPGAVTDTMESYQAAVSSTAVLESTLESTANSLEAVIPIFPSIASTGAARYWDLHWRGVVGKAKVPPAAAEGRKSKTQMACTGRQAIRNGSPEEEI
ncbi:hypothetical protein ACH5RR_012553 [Cinchona calisaya]|uniref:Uncharacterized protein n=1 Tax=Cinchona calisaya TaxID=153742 RepID=A0ABD3ABN7_9GENT